MENAKIVISFNQSDGIISFSNSTGIKTIAKIKDNVVSLDTPNKELALRVSCLIQHISADIQALVENY